MHLVKPSVSAPMAGTAGSACKIKIHTSAVLQVLEIVSKQVLPENKRMIGTLLGIRLDDGLLFEIKDAFMVPCNETGDSIAIEEETHRKLYQLYKKAHLKEHVLGWFGSSEQIDNTTALIHDFYSHGTDRAYPSPALHLNVQYIKDGEVHVPEFTTYLGAVIGKSANNTQKMGWKTVSNNNSYVFTPIPHAIVDGSSTEQIAANFLKTKTVNVDSTQLSLDLSFLTTQLNAVTDNIDAILNRVESASLDALQNDDNLDLLRLLSNSLLSKPQILDDMEELRRHFHNHNQDVIMIEYLTKAVKEQIELIAKATSDADKKH